MVWRGGGWCWDCCFVWVRLFGVGMCFTCDGSRLGAWFAGCRGYFAG